MIVLKDEFLDTFVLCPHTNKIISLRFIDKNDYKWYIKIYPNCFTIEDDKIVKKDIYK